MGGKSFLDALPFEPRGRTREAVALAAQIIEIGFHAIDRADKIGAFGAVGRIDEEAFIAAHPARQCPGAKQFRALLLHCRIVSVKPAGLAWRRKGSESILEREARSGLRAGAARRNEEEGR